MKIEVIVTAQFAWIHCWSLAPVVVDYLKHPHRHMFHVKVGYLVVESRQREFFIEKQRLEYAIEGFIKMPKENKIESSCEDIATHLRGMLGAAWVEVWEDGENGVRVEL